MKDEAEHTRLNELYWDKWAESSDKPTWVNRYLRKCQRALVASLDIKQNMSFLDVGCGTGFALGRIAASVGGVGQFYGVDLSQGMIDKAEDAFKDDDSFHFLKANAESIPLANDSFHIIICSNSFHHYLNPLKTLREMRRLLRPAGKVHILDPTADSWFLRIANKIVKRFERTHVKMYSTREFQDMFREAGLEYVDTRALYLSGESASLLERLINSANKNKIHIGRK